GQYAIDRLRPEQSAKRMVERNDGGSGDENGHVTIERQECERAEHVKMGLDPSSHQVNQQRRSQRLSDRDDVTSDYPAGPLERQRNGKRADRAAEKHCSPHMNVRLT